MYTHTTYIIVIDKLTVPFIHFLHCFGDFVFPHIMLCCDINMISKDYIYANRIELFEYKKQGVHKI